MRDRWRVWCLILGLPAFLLFGRRGYIEWLCYLRVLRGA